MSVFDSYGLLFNREREEKYREALKENPRLSYMPFYYGESIKSMYTAINSFKQCALKCLARDLVAKALIK